MFYAYVLKSIQHDYFHKGDSHDLGKKNFHIIRDDRITSRRLKNSTNNGKPKVETNDTVKNKWNQKIIGLIILEGIKREND